MRDSNNNAPILKDVNAIFANYWLKITGREANPLLEAHNSVEIHTEMPAERFEAQFPKNCKALQQERRHA